MGVVVVPATTDHLPVAATASAPVILPTGAPLPGPPGRPRRGTGTIGTLLFVTADAMVLAAIVATYLAIKGGSAAWPPKGVHVGTYIPTMISVTVVMSAFSIQWGVFAARRNDGRNAVIALILTVFLGISIANLEWLAIVRAGFGFKAHTYATLYYLLFGYHLFHLLAAIVLSLVLAFRTVAGHFSADRHDPLRAGAVYWQYTNVVWLLILSVLFLASRHG
ncbi:MAG TPA: cytochrome c oxidase subunit 3 [Acidimicrobiales bacterium]|jgi:cytochrome c oxidase subunit 3|nr:cytochrome c oxidase subunit 3 [Acidimicrobiales bacterium]